MVVLCRSFRLCFYVSFFFFFFTRDRHTKQKKKICMLKTHLGAVYDCKTSQIILNLLHMHIQCYIDDLYHIGRIVAFAMFSK